MNAGRRPLAVRLYARLTALLPRDLREEYRGEAEDVFYDLWRQRRSERGGLGAWMFWIWSATQLIDCAVRARRDQRDHSRWTYQGDRLRGDHKGRGEVVGTIIQDVKVAFRVLAKAPGFTVVSVLTLAVAIGANTAIFSVVDAVLLRPLSYPDAEEIVTITLDASGAGVAELPFSDRGYWHFREKNRSFEEFGAYGSTLLALTGDGDPSQLSVGLMSNSAYQVLRVSPLRGRLPSDEEDINDGPLVALLSHGLWVGRFGSDPGVIGRTIQLNDQTREVIGIMPPEFAFPSSEIDLWIPRQLNPESENFGGHGIPVIARLRDGATVVSATTDAESLIQRFEEAGYGPQWLSNVFTGRADVRTALVHGSGF